MQRAEGSDPQRSAQTAYVTFGVQDARHARHAARLVREYRSVGPARHDEVSSVPVTERSDVSTIL